MSKPPSAVRARARAPLALLTILALATALAGCGGSSGDPIASRSPAELIAASRAAAERVSSVHVVSSASQGPLSLTAEFELTSGGGRAKLSFLGLSYEAIRIGDTLYLKGNPAFYRRLFGGSRVHVPSGAWLRAPVEGRLAQFAGLTELGSRLELALRTTGPLTRGAVTTVDGRPAVEVKEAAKLFSGSIYIAASGQPYPIEIVKHGRENGRTTFSGWDQPVSLTAPADTIALATLERQGP